MKNFPPTPVCHLPSLHLLPLTGNHWFVLLYLLEFLCAYISKYRYTLIISPLNSVLDVLFYTLLFFFCNVTMSSIEIFSN